MSKYYTMYSDIYVDQALTENNIRNIFEAVLFVVRRNAAYMGVWQMAAVANVLSRQVVSVYQLYG
jgi:hypothetical protein